ncbi:NADH-cytochrome b5 reductase [Blastocladiella emersonii ATCC 22665]|nr:NADH-cytochrome b5 reductase [Blastocladiella emersonii ATCC 22665]
MSSTTNLGVLGLAGLVGAVFLASPEHTTLAAAGAVVGSVLLFVLAGTGSSKVKVALSTEEWRDFPLISKEQLSPNTAIYRFKLQTPDTILGLPIGQHVSIKARIGDKDVQRSYTPVSSDDDKGIIDLLVKTYPTGNISKVFADLKPGDKITMKGPKGSFKYTPNMCRAIAMIAGGTGLTPMLQVIKAILKNPEDSTKVSFIFANVSYDDILLKDELDKLAATHSDRFTVHYVLNSPPPNWTGSAGFVTKDVVSAHLPAPAKDVKLLLCGPPPMVKAMTAIAEELGFDKAQTISKAADQVFKF